MKKMDVNGEQKEKARKNEEEEVEEIRTSAL